MIFNFQVEMAGKKKGPPLSREEILIRKKMRERERYKKLKEDPVMREVLKEKERKKYENKKRKKQVKPAREMTPRERRLKRKMWRKHRATYIKRKTLLNSLPESPPSSETDDNPAPLNIQILSGRKRISRDRSKVIQRNKKLVLENECLRRSKEKYRKKYYRLIQQYKAPVNTDLTPKRKVKQIMKKMDKQEVARKLLFGEALKAQIKKNLTNVSTNKRKRTAVHNILGDGTILKKYKITKEVKDVVKFRCNAIRKRRHEKQSLKYKMEIQTFLQEDENSRVAPGKKDCLTKKKIKKQKRFLNDTMRNLYKTFIFLHSYKISYSFFCKCRPFWVVYQKLHQRDTCLCKIHANMDYAVSSLFMNKVINEKTGKDIAAKLCCSGDYRPSVSCLLRKCKKCTNNEIHFHEFDGEVEVNYFCWVQQKEKFKDKTGNYKEVNHTIKLHKRISLYTLAQILLSTIDRFMAHEAAILNQFSELKYLKLKLSESEVLLQIDFSENYSLKYAEEIQSFHFGGSRKQVSIHTSSLIFKESTYGNIKYRSICTFSESLQHDAIAILAHLEPVFKIIKNVKPVLRGLHFISDSPTSQYRNKLILFVFGNLLTDYFPDLEVATWNYLEAGHGKGVADGIGGTIKRTADRLVNEGRDVNNFQLLIASLKESVRSIDIEVVTKDDVNEAKKKIDVEKVTPFKGIMKVHQLVIVPKPHQEPTVWIKTLSCLKCLKDKPLLDNTNKLNCTHNKLGEVKYSKYPEIGHSTHVKESRHNIETSTVHESIRPSTSGEKTHIKIKEQAVKTTANIAKPIHMSTAVINWIDIKEGAFVLVKVCSATKTSTNYKYLCIVQKKDEDDGEITVQGLRVTNKFGTEFVVKENDIFNINIDSIIEILTDSKLVLKNRAVTYKFPKPVDVYEKL